MYDIVCSLVIYKNDKSQLLDAIESFLDTNLNVRLLLIDNSPTNILQNIKIDPRVEYIHNPLNPGYGSSHNIGLKKYAYNSKFYLVLNPDIYYTKGVLEDIIIYMISDSNIGLLTPKVLYPDGSIQYLAKLLPTPFIFFARRFSPIFKIMKKTLDKFELRFSGYDKIMEAPYLSGYFMIFRTEVFNKLNGFDENIFMHMEDLDITRRCINAGYKTIYYPHQIVYHDHLYKTFLNLSNLKMYLKSSFYYFNKWGWFFDKNRVQINTNTIKKILKKKIGNEN